MSKPVEMPRKSPICIDSRKCGAKKNNRCTCLSETYLEDGACPFCKPDLRVTNGIRYELPKKNRKY